MLFTDLTSKYLDALDQGSFESVIALFTPDATVDSPLYGEMTARSFYRDLLADTSNSQTALIEVYESSGAANSVALHFNYRWTLKDGSELNFECVDIFKICVESERFTSLKIIYDTYPIRNDFENSRNSG